MNSEPRTSRRRARTPPGSNNWAVAGPRTTHGGAIVSNDMHLGLRPAQHLVSRADELARERSGRRAVVGVTLPGTPATVVGSNGDVAWGFTNSQGDWADLVVLEFDAADSMRYRTPDGWRSLERIPEMIEVAGASADTLWVEKTIWGPVWDKDSSGRRLRPALDRARCRGREPRAHPHGERDERRRGRRHGRHLRDSRRRTSCAPTGPGGSPGCSRAGFPAGSDGTAGRRCRGPTARSDGTATSDPAENPRVVDPRRRSALDCEQPGHRRATTSQLIGDGGYALGARASQIRDDLSALGDAVTETGSARRRARRPRAVAGAMAGARPRQARDREPRLTA